MQTPLPCRNTVDCKSISSQDDLENIIRHNISELKYWMSSHITTCPYTVIPADRLSYISIFRALHTVMLEISPHTNSKIYNYKANHIAMCAIRRSHKVEMIKYQFHVYQFHVSPLHNSPIKARFEDLSSNLEYRLMPLLE